MLVVAVVAVVVVCRRLSSLVFACAGKHKPKQELPESEVGIGRVCAGVRLKRRTLIQILKGCE